MAESTTYDPFAVQGGRLGSVATRLGCTEGQLWTMVIGLLLVVAVWVNALPNVAWRLSPIAAQTPGGIPPEALPPPVNIPPAEGLAPLPVPDGPVLGAELPTPLDLGPVPALPPPAPADQPAVPPAPAAPPTDSAPAPFAVVSAGWASRYAGTPLATFGVPEGSVPVSARAAASENITFLTFSGSAAPLVLDVDPAGANRLPELALLRLCVVTEATFTVGRGDVPLEQAPAMDCERSVDGVSLDGAAFSFDLATIDLTGVTGLAIGPVTTPTSPDFQVVLRLPTTTTAPAKHPSSVRSSS